MSSTAKKVYAEYGSAIQGMFVTWEHTPPDTSLTRNDKCTGTSPACDIKISIQLNMYTLNLGTKST